MKQKWYENDTLDKTITYSYFVVLGGFLIFTILMAVFEPAAFRLWAAMW